MRSVRRRVVLGALAAFALSRPFAPALAASPPATFDLGDFDPAMPAFVTRLVAPTGRPGPGPLRSLIAEPKGVTLRFRDLALYLPGGEIERASTPPLVAEMLRRRATERLVPESAATYAGLAEAVQLHATEGAVVRVIEANGTVSSAIGTPPVPSPSPFVPITEAQPFASHWGGEGRQAFDLLRVGPPLADPLWIRAGDGPLLVQPFTYRVLVWNPRTRALRTTALGDDAASSGLIRDTPSGSTLASMTTLLATTSRNTSVAVVFTTERGVTTVSWGGLREQPTASVMKLAILAAYTEASANGFLRSTYTDSLADAMIVQSANGAANTLIDLLSPGRVNGTIERLGLRGTHLGQHFEAAGWGDWRDNTTTARDCDRLMNAVVGGEGPGDHEWARSLLARSQAGGSVRDAVQSGMKGAAVYEKRGWYAGVENEVVRVQLAPDRAVTVAILQPDVRDIAGTHALFRDLAAQATAALHEGRVK